MIVSRLILETGSLRYRTANSLDNSISNSESNSFFNRAHHWLQHATTTDPTTFCMKCVRARRGSGKFICGKELRPNGGRGRKVWFRLVPSWIASWRGMSV